jgi:hypothetical protein
LLPFLYLHQSVPTWLIVVAGWFVVHHLSQKRDQRKEARERVDQLVSAILSIEERAVRFHQSDSYQGDVARSLLFDIQRIIAKLKRHPFGSFVISAEQLHSKISMLANLRTRKPIAQF